MFNNMADDLPELRDHTSGPVANVLITRCKRYKEVHVTSTKLVTKIMCAPKVPITRTYCIPYELHDEALGPSDTPYLVHRFGNTA